MPRIYGKRLYAKLTRPSLLSASGSGSCPLHTSREHALTDGRWVPHPSGASEPELGRPSSIVANSSGAAGQVAEATGLSSSELAPGFRLLLGCELKSKCRVRPRIFKIEQHGSQSSELSTNSSFVLVRVPVRIEGEGERGEATVRYSIGSFSGRDTTLPLQAGLNTTLRVSVPMELFLPGERLTVEVLAGGSAGPQTVLLAKRWEIGLGRQGPILRADS